MSAANREIAIVVQAEHARAVDSIEAIVRVAGVNEALLGPYDLSASLGKMGRSTNRKSCRRSIGVTAASRAVEMPLGYFRRHRDGCAAARRARLLADRRERRHAVPRELPGS